MYKIKITLYLNVLQKEISGVMDIIQFVKESLDNPQPTKITARKLFYIFFVLGDLLHILIACRNFAAVKKIPYDVFVEKWKYYYNRNGPNITADAYNHHRDTHKLRSWGALVSNVVGLCVKCVKLSTNYYKVIWRWTDGYGMSLIGRATLFAALDTVSEISHEVVTAVIETVYGSKTICNKEILMWLVTLPIRGLERATSCYLVAYCVGRSEPLVFHAIWMACRISYMLGNLCILMFVEKDSTPQPDYMNIVSEKSGYPKDRIIIVKDIEPATGFRKHVAAKYCSYLFRNYIFVSSRLVKKITNDQEAACIILREAGAWKMWRYSCSNLKLLYYCSHHAILGQFIIKAYGSGSIEEIFRLEPGMHPVVTLWVSWGFFIHAINSILGLIAGCLEAQLEYQKDDFVFDTMGYGKLVNALARQTETDLSSSLLYDGLHSKRFFGEPTLWERLNRIIQRYHPISEPLDNTI